MNLNCNFLNAISFVFSSKSFHHMNGAFSRKILTPNFDHSFWSIHSSGALSKHDITAAPFHAVIAGSISFGLVTMSNCSHRYRYGICNPTRFCSHLPMPVNFMPPPTTKMQPNIFRFNSSFAMYQMTEMITIISFFEECHRGNLNTYGIAQYSE